MSAAVRLMPSVLTANLGYVVREPDEAVPPYASKPSSHASQTSGSVYSGRSRPASEAEHDEEHEHEHEHEHAHEDHGDQ